MCPDQSRSPIDALQTQLRETLDAHLTSLSQQYEQALAETRRTAAEEAEQAIQARLQAVEAEWSGRLESEVAGVRMEAQRHLAAELTRVRIEAEQQAAESAARVREELEQALATERQRAEGLVQAERRRVEAELEEARRQAHEAAERAAHAERARAADVERVQAAEADRARAVSEREAADAARVQAEAARVQADSGRAHAEAARLKAEEARGKADAARATAEAERTKAAEDAAARAELKPAAPDRNIEHLVAGVQAIDGSRSLSDALKVLLQHASTIAPRALVFLVNGDRLKSWKGVGFPQFDTHPFESAIVGTGLLAQAIQTGTPVTSSPSQPAPTFAGLGLDRTALAAPIVVGGRAVAVVYADNGPEGEAPGSWRAAVEALVRHAATQLALLTAMRTVQAVSASAAPVPTGTGGAVAPDADVQEQGARRYARLLVSEIKLYNEAAVRAGREQRDLLRRLGPEIERARRLYEERVSPRLTARTSYFHQELVQTLADGDPGLLGKG